MIARLLAAVALLALAGDGVTDQAPAPPAANAASATPAARSPRNANYAINVRLDPNTRTLTGDQILSWRNVSTASTQTLRFHLYYNAWRNTHSSWMREVQLAGDAADVLDRPESDWAWIDIGSLRLLSGAAPADLTSRLRFIAPDDGNTNDRTIVEAPLDSPVAPGETILVQIAWSSRVPRTFAEQPPVPFGHRILLGLWYLRRQGDRSTGMDRGRDRPRARAGRRRRWRHDASLLCGGRSRLRVDHESPIPRADRDVPARYLAARRDAAAPAART
ncbi:MAG: hypothetical protein LC804_00280 [Acidobacteria bacterium]|nr:hypothetical protein [Acidobacteriota bacterium]